MSAQPFSMASRAERLLEWGRPISTLVAPTTTDMPRRRASLATESSTGNSADAGVEALGDVVQLFQAVVIVGGDGDASLNRHVRSQCQLFRRELGAVHAVGQNPVFLLLGLALGHHMVFEEFQIPILALAGVWSIKDSSCMSRLRMNPSSME